MNGKNRIGEWLYYFPDGKLISSKKNYKNWLLNGEVKTYYKTSKIIEILHYRNGKLHGNTKRFTDNENLLDDLNYENGKLQGAEKY